MKFVSIIVTHFAMNDTRSETMRLSLESMFENTKYPYELIVIDNGKSTEDSKYLLELNERGKITTYIRNANNMHFGYARNQGLSLAQGDYICIADNDIRYMDGWLEECVHILDSLPDSLVYATPISYPNSIMDERYNVGTVKIGDKEYKKSMRAGSNCFVIRRDDFMSIGWFETHRIAGSKWSDAAVGMGYSAVVIEPNMIEDMGLRKGYNLQQAIPIELKLPSGESIYYNADEFKRDNPDIKFVKQRRF